MIHAPRPTEKAVEFGKTAREGRSFEFGSVLNRAQARKNRNAASLDSEIMIAAAKRLTAILDHSQPTPLGAVIGSKLFEMNDTVDHAMDRLVKIFRRHVIKQQHRCIGASEEVFQCEDLSAVSQRTLR